MATDNLKTLLDSLPDIILRVHVPKLINGMYARNTLRNEDSKGDGPKGRFYIGNRAAYPKDAFCEWFKGKIHFDDSPLN